MGKGYCRLNYVRFAYRSSGSMTDLNEEFFPNSVKLAAVVALIAAAIVGWVIWKPSTRHAVSAKEAFGCFVASHGERAVIDRRGFRIVGSSSDAIGVRLDQTRSGLRLLFDEPPFEAMRYESTKDLFPSGTMSLRVQTEPNTSPLVDGFWIAERQGITYYGRRPHSKCE